MTVRTLIFAETSYSRQQEGTNGRATASTTQHRAGDMPVRKMIRGNGTGSITPTNPGDDNGGDSGGGDNSGGGGGNDEFN